LKAFEKYGKIPLKLQTVTADTLSKLQDYFYLEANVVTQTASKYIELFKMFLNWALQNGYTDNRKFQTFKSIKQPDTLKVILTKEDIVKIKAAKLGRFDSLKNVRELLVLSTLTGLRYSDYSRIAQEHIKVAENGQKILIIRQEKTGDFVELPLTKEAEKIITRLLIGKLHSISNQKMNKYVKELCKIAGVDELFEVHTFKGKMKVSKHVPKYELVTTHTGRRTFATNLLLKGIPAHVVMRFTGHKDYKSFAKYVNIPKQAEMDMVKLALVG
jgi:site-specific recombinase XerD